MKILAAEFQLARSKYRWTPRIDDGNRNVMVRAREKRVWKITETIGAHSGDSRMVSKYTAELELIKRMADEEPHFIDGTYGVKAVASEGYNELFW